ncbi:MAG: bifunctional ornithine acetyltransferase/N-acetylglutamate synthase [Methanomassiliicoccus sp.]|nr:bifunctional ornithine acetyltransferase/N-acetylglutamate synthase [Methanomassiliicoccus sp.]
MNIIDGGVTTPKGFKATGVHCGIKKERLDLAMIYSDRPAIAACAYTQNKMRAAPVELMIQRHSEKLQGFIVNSGNANAITGPQGMKDAITMSDTAAKALGVRPELVGVASTGVIGRFLPMDKLVPGIERIATELGQGREYDHRANMAILTTDKTIKEAACQVTLKDGTVITIAGMAKGSGMISPSMKTKHATTLSFITTDAVLTKPPEWKWQETINKSFNMINVDGDQSTNDISVLMANGAAGGRPVDDNHDFWNGVLYVLQSLAKQVVLDGEGATKLIELKVTGAKTDREARTAGRWIISSSLVKTAIFGADPNFGRVLAALGNSGSEFDLNKLRLTIGSNGEEVVLFEGGVPLVKPCSEAEVRARKLLSDHNIAMHLELGVGNGQAEAWGCDLTYEYVKINAEYTT